MQVFERDRVCAMWLRNNDVNSSILRCRGRSLCFGIKFIVLERVSMLSTSIHSFPLFSIYPYFESALMHIMFLGKYELIIVRNFRLGV